jgi:hypothetical protein
MLVDVVKVVLVVDDRGAVLVVVAGRDVEVDVLLVVVVGGASTVRQLARCTDGAIRPVTVLPKTRSMFASPPVRWQ